MRNQEPVWCVSARVGPTGTRHYKPNGTIYVFPQTEYGIVKVVGRHRVTQRFITVLMSARDLKDWQVSLVNCAEVLAELRTQRRPCWDGTDASRTRAHQVVNALQQYHH